MRLLTASLCIVAALTHTVSARSGGFAQSCEDYTVAYVDEGSDPQGWYLEGACKDNQGDYVLAAIQLGRCIAYDKTHNTLYYKVK
jgi:hypothetical protein